MAWLAHTSQDWLKKMVMTQASQVPQQSISMLTVPSFLLGDSKEHSDLTIPVDIVI